MRPPGCGRPVGDGWHLIRRSAHSLIRRWHEATDNMAVLLIYICTYMSVYICLV